MPKIKLKIIKLGESKHDREWKFIENLKRKNNTLFEITDIEKTNLPNADLFDWGYSDKILSDIINKNSSNHIVIGFLDYPLEGDFFARILSKNIGVVTFFETDKIFVNANVDLKNYILLMIYISIVIAYIPTNENNYHLFHNETRGCLFDMNGLKEDIIMAATNPKICYECETKLRKTLLPIDFIDKIKKELKQIKKPLYYRIVDSIKAHPILSLIITVIFTIILNILSSAIYDILTK